MIIIDRILLFTHVGIIDYKDFPTSLNLNERCVLIAITYITIDNLVLV